MSSVDSVEAKNAFSFEKWTTPQKQTNKQTTPPQKATTKQLDTLLTVKADRRKTTQSYF